MCVYVSVSLFIHSRVQCTGRYAMLVESTDRNTTERLTVSNIDINGTNGSIVGRLMSQHAVG